MVMRAQKQDWIALDKQHVWHPFTQMEDWIREEPIMIERAEGNLLIDVEGCCYIDGVSSLWANIHGHNRREINDAVRSQLEKVAHTTALGLASMPAAQLAERLIALAPGRLRKVFYSDSGSTAVEVALKQAFQFWRHRGYPNKQTFVYLDQAYHGDTLGAVSVGGIDLFHQTFEPLLFKGYRVPTPQFFGYPMTKAQDEARDLALAALEELLLTRTDEIAAVIVEPLVQGAAGMLIQPEGYLKGIERLCRRYNVLLIADEVATGFGRTGKMFACEYEDVEPDFLCLAKALSGGYMPLAATLATDDIYAAFLGPRRENKTFFHGHTFTGNPLACAAALASLKIFEDDAVLDGLTAKIALLQHLLEQEVAPLRHVGEIRQKGFMVGIALIPPPESGVRPFDNERNVGLMVCDAVRNYGVILRNLGDVVVLMPPLSISTAELSHLVQATATAIQDVCR